MEIVVNGWYVLVGVLFIAIICTMIGYVLRDTDHIRALDAERGNHLAAQIEYCKANDNLQDQVIALSKDVEHLTMWREAVYNLCIINHIDWDETNADATLAFLFYVEKKEALDPAVSREARALINKAKREHGKKVRKAADRKLERTEREYEARLNTQLNSKNLWKAEAQNRAEALALARNEFSMYQGIVSQELDHFIRLPSVRKACNESINRQHKALQEL